MNHRRCCLEAPPVSSDAAATGVRVISWILADGETTPAKSVLSGAAGYAGTKSKASKPSPAVLSAPPLRYGETAPPKSAVKPTPVKKTVQSVKTVQKTPINPVRNGAQDAAETENATQVATPPAKKTLTIKSVSQINSSTSEIPLVSPSNAGTQSTPAAKTAPQSTPLVKTAPQSAPAAKTAIQSTPAAKSVPKSSPAAKTAPHSSPVVKTTPATKTTPQTTPATKTAPQTTPATKTTPQTTPATKTTLQTPPATKTTPQTTPTTKTAPQSTSVVKTAAQSTSVAKTAAQSTPVAKTAAQSTPAAKTIPKSSPAVKTAPQSTSADNNATPTPATAAPNEDVTKTPSETDSITANAAEVKATSAVKSTTDKVTPEDENISTASPSEKTEESRSDDKKIEETPAVAKKEEDPKPLTNMTPEISQAMADELEQIMIKIWHKLPDDTRTDADKVVVEAYKSNVADELRNLLELNIKQRLLDVHNKLCVKVNLGRRPSSKWLSTFERKFAVVGIHEAPHDIDDASYDSFIAELRSFKYFDALNAADGTKLGGVRVATSPVYNFARVPEKLWRAEELKRTRKKSESKKLPAIDDKSSNLSEISESMDVEDESLDLFRLMEDGIVLDECMGSDEED